MLVPYVGQVVSRSVLGKAVPAVKQFIPTISSVLAGVGIVEILDFMFREEPEMTGAVAKGLGVTKQDLVNTASELTSNTASSSSDAEMLGYDLDAQVDGGVNQSWYTAAGIALAIIGIMYLVVTKTNVPKYAGDALASILSAVGLEELAKKADAIGEERYAATLEDKRADQRKRFGIYEAQIKVLKDAFGGDIKYAINALKVFASINIAELEEYVDLKEAIAGH